MTPMRLAGYALFLLSIVLGAAALVQLLVSFGVRLPSGIAQWADWLVTRDAARWQLGLATMASSLLAHAGARTLMDQDERNAALYELTEAKVKALVAERLDKAKSATATGDEAALKTFFSDLRRILEAEHAAWFLSRPSSDPAALVDDKLKELR